MDYQIGDVITYQPFGGGTRRVRVTHKEPDIKNGRPGFDGQLIGDVPDGLGDGVWGYDDQILMVSRRVS